MEEDSKIPYKWIVSGRYTILHCAYEEECKSLLIDIRQLKKVKCGNTQQFRMFIHFGFLSYRIVSGEPAPGMPRF